MEQKKNAPHSTSASRPWRRALRIAAWVAAAAAGLLLLVLVIASLVLTPDRLTRMVRDYGTAYLVKGRVDVGRVDLSIWSTFPHAELTVDSLRVVNLDVPKEYGDVLCVQRFSGRLNLAALLIGRISVAHALIDNPRVTLWSGGNNPARSSLSILPASEQADNENSGEPLSLPDIRVNRFAIGGDACVRYVSEADSVDISLNLRRTALNGQDRTPQYALTLGGDFSGLKPYIDDSAMPLTFMADGGIAWESSRPMALSLHDFRFGFDRIDTETSLKADFTDGIRVDALDFELKPLELQRVAELAAALPALRGMVPVIESDATFSLKAHLLKPYECMSDTMPMPALEAVAKINGAPVSIPTYYLTFTNLAMELKARISDAGLDSSTIDLKHLDVKFPASDFTLAATATNLKSDPLVNGCFKGKVNFSNLNPKVWTLIGMRLRGAMDADVDFDMNLSDLTPQTFHRAHLEGETMLRNFEALLPADTIAAGMTRASLTFGSDNKVNGVDSLLTVALKVDSAWACLPELNANLAQLAIGIGVSNTSNTADTTTITPMGGKFTLKSLRYVSVADSTRALLRGLSGNVSLKRYKGQTRAPELGAGIAAKRLVFADGASRASLQGVNIAVNGYASPRKKRKKRVLSAADSARIAARRDSMLLAAGQYERMDLNIDRSTVTLLRRWHITGHMRAAGGRIMTPLFPLRTRLKGLDVSFNPDSLMLNKMEITAGRSDFKLNGSITNIQRALGRRNSTRPLQLKLNFDSDTLNINQLTQAAFRGAAYVAKSDSLAAATSGASLDATDTELEAAAETQAAGEVMAIVVPMNIDAQIKLSAKNIIYSTLHLKDFGGEILVANGAANLRDLHASTDIGSVDLNMLYYAPTRSDVEFGMGLDLKKFNIGRVTELMPTLDSIMPILNTLGGIIDVGISATTPVDSALNIKFPELRAMVNMSGDSLRVLDEKTFKTVSKWLLFHDKSKNMIDHMDVQLTVDDNRLTLYPFMFDFDRYRIGVMGNNDMNMNLNYHVSILKSPIPFKFGINIKGSTDKMKIRLGRARFKENMAAETRQLSDTLRVNLAREIRNVFTRGAKAARLAPLDVRRPADAPDLSADADTISGADSLFFIQNGLIESVPVQ